jgi:phosphoribosylanthranilate isomerase
MTWVKVCGIRTEEALAAAEEAGADAVGFVLADSPRRVTVLEARRLATRTGLETILVTVDTPPDRVFAWVDEVGATGVQPHGRYSALVAEAATGRKLRVLRPVPVADRVELAGIPTDQVPLLDTADPDRHGGTGRRFDWDLAAGLDRPWVLAGGLGPEDVADAVARLRPWGVDASSRLETEPGVKDPDRIRRFVEEAKSV